MDDPAPTTMAGRRTVGPSTDRLMARVTPLSTDRRTASSADEAVDVRALDPAWLAPRRIHDDERRGHEDPGAGCQQFGM